MTGDTLETWHNMRMPMQNLEPHPASRPRVAPLGDLCYDLPANLIPSGIEASMFIQQVVLKYPTLRRGLH